MTGSIEAHPRGSARRVATPRVAPPAAIPRTVSQLGERLERLTGGCPAAGPARSVAVAAAVDLAFDFAVTRLTLSPVELEELPVLVVRQLNQAPLCLINVELAAASRDPLHYLRDSVERSPAGPPPPLPRLSSRAALEAAVARAVTEPDQTGAFTAIVLAAAGYAATRLGLDRDELALAGKRLWEVRASSALVPVDLGYRLVAKKEHQRSAWAEVEREFLAAVEVVQERARLAALARLDQTPRSAMKARQWQALVRRAGALPERSTAARRSETFAIEALTALSVEASLALVYRVDAVVRAVAAVARIGQTVSEEELAQALDAIAAVPLRAMPPIAFKGLVLTLGCADNALSEACQQATKRWSQPSSEASAPAGGFSPPTRSSPGSQGGATAVNQAFQLVSKLQGLLDACAGRSEVAELAAGPERDPAQVWSELEPRLDFNDTMLWMRQLMHPKEIREVVAGLYARQHASGADPEAMLDALVDGLDQRHVARGTEEQWRAAIDGAPFAHAESARAAREALRGLLRLQPENPASVDQRERLR